MAESSAATRAVQFRQEIRVQRSVLTGIEKRVLRWLAVRLPGWVTSDQLTVLALIAMVGTGLSYWLASVTPLGFALATACLVINWFGDSLDGTLARVRGQERPRYGYYVDHIVDVVGITFLFGGLALSAHMQPAIAAILLIAYFLLSLEIFLATYSFGTFQMSFLGVGPTELRVLLAAANGALLVRGDAGVWGTDYTLLDVGGLIGAVGLAATFTYSVIGHVRALHRADPLPPRADR